MVYLETLFDCIKRQDCKRLTELLRQDPQSISNKHPETGLTILHYACTLGDDIIVDKLLKDHPCDLSAADKRGYTPLHTACFFDHEKLVKLLLNKSTESVNLQDNCGWTALIHAARNGNLHICQLLVEHGNCKVELAGKNGKTSCHYAAEYGHLDILKFLYDYAPSVVPDIVLAKESVLDTPTLLHLAALNNCTEVVDFLKQRLFPPIGRYRLVLDYNAPNSQEMYPDEIAALRGYTSLRGKLSDYRKVFEVWVRDINSERCSLDFMKLCICGHPRVGKSSLKASLSKKEAAPTIEGESPNTFGIDVSQVNLSGSNFSVWDFAGQVDSFITHQFFISTESTIFNVIVNLTDRFEEQCEELRWWLSFIKARNLGQVPYLASSADSGNYVPMCTSVPEPQQPPRRPLSSESPRRPLSSEPPEEKRRSIISEDAMFGSVVLPVPVIVIGSHYDLLSPEVGRRALERLQDFANEMGELFKIYLVLSDRVFPLACNMPKSEEMLKLKQELVAVRSRLMKVQPQYPRVAMMIVDRIEKLKSEQPKLKVIVWEQFVDIMHEVNRLISDRQLSYICKCLANAGVVVYFDQGALGNYVFIDPLWLCRDVLGKALAPEGFPQAQIAPLQAPAIKEEVIKARLAEHMDANHVNVILELLQRFDLCHLDKRKKTYLFPSFSKDCFDVTLWQPDNGLHYIGRRLSCEDETDTFPPGFLSRLQVQVYKLLQMDQTMHMFGNSFLVEVGSGYHCLVKLANRGKTLDVVGRARDTHSRACLALIDMVQGAVAALVKTSCPTVFLNVKVISCSDLQAHSDDPTIYPIDDVIRAKSGVNNRSGKAESLVDLLYFGDQSLRTSYTSQHTPISHIRGEDVEKLEELLDDGEKTWRDLAKELGLGVYIKLLEGKSPHSTRMLLLKYGERPRWTLESLLSALKRIDRLDAWALLRSHYVVQ